MPASSAPGLHLAWNVKSTFRGYVQAAGGAIDVAEPAIESADRFCFPLDRARPGPATVGIHRFAGSVRFTAHGGAMDLLVRDPWLHEEPGRVRLSVAGTEATRTSGGRLFLAELDVVEAVRTDDSRWYATAPTVLLAEGAVAFDFRYPAGTTLAPVGYVLPVRPAHGRRVLTR